MSEELIKKLTDALVIDPNYGKCINLSLDYDDIQAVIDRIRGLEDVLEEKRDATNGFRARIEELEKKLRTTSLEALAISDTNNDLQARIAELEKELAHSDSLFRALQSATTDDIKALSASQARLSEAVKVLEKFNAHYPMGIKPFLDEAGRAAKAFITTLGGEK